VGVIGQRLLRYWLCGLLGGLIHELLVRRGILVLPRYDRGRRELSLGSLAAMFIGVAAAVLADGAPELALASAIAGPMVLENTVSILLGAKRRADD